jgi:ElaB/YqjD/DUF883 family membrane-anchored ribosome-binding protein
MKGNELIANTLEKTTSELKAVIREAENLLKTTGNTQKEALTAARARFEKTLNDAKGEVLDLEEEVIEKVKGAAHTTDVYVHDHAWNVAGAGICVGLLVGLLVGRSNHGVEKYDH